MNKTAENLAQDIPYASKSYKGVVFLGGDCTDTEWRKTIKDRFKDKFMFLDPYEKEWDPEKDIYNELAGLVIADYIVFYKGGKGSAREKKFLSFIDKEFKDFEDIESLSSYIDGLEQPSRGLSYLLKKTARLMALNG